MDLLANKSKDDFRKVSFIPLRCLESSYPFAHLFGRNSSLASSRAGSAKLASNSIKTTRKMSIGSTIESAADLNLFSNSQNKESSRAGGLIYLVEVQYYLRLETGQVRWFELFMNCRHIVLCPCRPCSCRCRVISSVNWLAHRKDAAICSRRRS